MIRRLTAIALVLAVPFLSSPVGMADTADQARYLGAAHEAIRQGDWDKARALAARAGRIATDLVEWHRLRAGRGKWQDYRSFLSRNPHWPGLPLLRRRGEPLIPAEAAPRRVIEYFAQDGAQTGSGALALARAYKALGRNGDAEAGIVRAWRNLSFSKPEQDAFLQDWGQLLKPHHEARLDMLLWRGLSGEARMMLPLVSKGWQALAEARIALRQNRKGVDGLIKAVPMKLQSDPGLAFERFLWRFRKGRNADATDLILEYSKSAEHLGKPERWANARRQLARSLMRSGQAEKAYRVAASHYLAKGRHYADLEWLSGYVALRHLKDPETALRHFEAFRAAVSTPISLGRAFYWLGRGYEALGRTKDADAAYREAARHQTTFYGQLAAERLGLPMDPALAGQEMHPDWRRATFLSDSVLQAALLLHKAGQKRLATRFMVHLAESLNRQELGQLADLAQANDDPHSALMIAKHAAKRGIILPRAYFPLHPLAAEELPVSPELALAIARRESEFFTEATSQAGARGMMQLMPRTARSVSDELGLEYARDKLLTDWRYNIRLGSTYLARLRSEFGPSLVLISAAYNAGPGRVRQWLRENGDPRRDDIDIVDWIEHIPFRETRNYVMRVAESLPVYRARLAGKPMPLRLLAELKGFD